MDYIGKLREAIAFAKSFISNIRNTECQWYMVWDAVLNQLVAKVPHCHVAPQLEIAPLPARVLERIANYRRPLLSMLDSNVDETAEADPSDLDGDTSLGAISISSIHTIPVDDTDSRSPDFTLVLISPKDEDEITDYYFLAIAECKPAGTRGANDGTHIARLSLATLHMEAQIARAFHVQPKLTKVFGIAASGANWLSRIYERDDPRLWALQEDVRQTQLYGDDHDYKPKAGGTRAKEAKEKADEEFIREFLKTERVLGTDESAEQLLVIQDFLSQPWFD